MGLRGLSGVYGRNVGQGSAVVGESNSTICPIARYIYELEMLRALGNTLSFGTMALVQVCEVLCSTQATTT